MWGTMVSLVPCERITQLSRIYSHHRHVWANLTTTILSVFHKIVIFIIYLHFVSRYNIFKAFPRNVQNLFLKPLNRTLFPIKTFFLKVHNPT